MLHRVFLGLGSNLGDRRMNLFQAMQLLGPEVRIECVSSLYETEPWGVKDQPRFLNCAVSALTDLAPLELLTKVKSIEKEIGREPAVRYGPRLIDLDILLYDDLVISSAELTIPHPRILERAFVLVPLAEIAGTLNHPTRKMSIRQLAGEINKNGVELFDSGFEDEKDE